MTTTPVAAHPSTDVVLGEAQPPTPPSSTQEATDEAPPAGNRAPAVLAAVTTDGALVLAPALIGIGIYTGVRMVQRSHIVEAITLIGAAAWPLVLLVACAGWATGWVPPPKLTTHLLLNVAINTGIAAVTGTVIAKRMDDGQLASVAGDIPWLIADASVNGVALAVGIATDAYVKRRLAAAAEAADDAAGNGHEGERGACESV
ncbi:hypothetical protein BU14_0328s0023 [Porphyra umbilicalis]|uniref:Uncharacterized protein n=1 Tax=Porphyra umbilicalis TaxID=2786 RepID=A0A1X6NYS1_PORUM|nr:hypothetical protein BU14_0328s0023 [Porphyra umbilicalis]|eukprot:OSX73771.1 hypothetical protein BU14_0328s0023 [Porphyra umbilicalis]